MVLVVKTASAKMNINCNAVQKSYPVNEVELEAGFIPAVTGPWPTKRLQTSCATEGAHGGGLPPP